MSVEVVVPEMGESITEATVGNWLKKEGDLVHVDEALVELETDKVTQEVLAPKGGVLTKILKQSGDTVQIKEIICIVEEGNNIVVESKQEDSDIQKQPLPKNDTLSPAVAKLIYDNHLQVDQIKASGKNGLLTKEDVLIYLEEQKKSKKEIFIQTESSSDNTSSMDSKPKEDREKIVPMTRLRQAIANRLLQSQQSAAILTTFNEVDMSYVMNLRKTYKEKFKETHDANLGFMSFFTKAVIRALKKYPSVNAEIRGTDIVYKNYCDIGIAVGSTKGLVVPIIRDADQMNFAQIEQEILRLSLKVKEGKIELQDLQGGTFTISNGGVYGSMLSTPILNPPQTGILGMHNIVKRAVVIGDEIKVRPIMYLALSYDHRLIDGKEAVSFLVSIKESIEDPIRLLLEV